MNIQFNNLSTDLQNQISQEFAEEIGRPDWQNILKAMQSNAVVICLKVGVLDNERAVNAMHELLDQEES